MHKRIGRLAVLAMVIAACLLAVPVFAQGAAGGGAQAQQPAANPASQGERRERRGNQNIREGRRDIRQGRQAQAQEGGTK